MTKAHFEAFVKNDYWPPNYKPEIGIYPTPNASYPITAQVIVIEHL
jgi:hypothetical protein